MTPPNKLPLKACPVTDAMIEAGIEAAWAHDPRYPPDFDEWQRDNARRIYLAMIAAQEPTVKVDQEPSGVVAIATDALEAVKEFADDDLSLMCWQTANDAIAAIAAYRTGSEG